jgi:hypothetical protein
MAWCVSPLCSSASAALGGLAGAPQGHLGLRPAVQVLQREDAAVQRERAQVREARVVAQHAQRPVDVVKRGHVIAPDGTGQPQIGQGVRRRERVASLLAGGQRLDRGRVVVGPLQVIKDDDGGGGCAELVHQPHQQLDAGD